MDLTDTFKDGVRFVFGLDLQVQAVLIICLTLLALYGMKRMFDGKN